MWNNERMNKKILPLVIIVIILAAVGFAVFHKGKPAPAGQTPDETGIVINKPISITASLALTGGKTEAGKAALNGAKLAAEEINANGGVGGRPIELAIKDTESKSPNAFSTDAITITPDTDIVIFNSKQANNLFSTWYGIAPAGMVAKAPEKNFLDTYKTVYKTDAAYGASNAYDAIYILARSIADKPKDVPSYMRRTNFKTVSFGNILFNELGGVETPDSWWVKK
jgi:ABC-type branched-subunit amino acid transport system substrate-binding protein